MNVSASRVTTGSRQIYFDLEKQLARFFGSESALLLPDGYLAPIAAAQAMAGEFSHVFIDESAHGALRDAAVMLHCPVHTFSHRNPVALAKKLARFRHSFRPLLLTDGMFSRDGSIAPLPEYLKVLPPQGRILVDDAHGAGVLGRSGKGSLEFCGVSRARVVQCLTLSKAFGAFGGAVLCDKKFRDQMVGRSRVFAGTTPLPPPLAGAALKSVGILAQGASLRRRLFENVKYLRARLAQAGWEIAETPGPIICLPTLSVQASAKLKRRLLRAGIYPSQIKYYKDAPAGIFRFVVSSAHSRREMDLLASVLADFKESAALSGRHAET